jgi:hypothetical protein
VDGDAGSRRGGRVITQGQNGRINLLTERALEALEVLVELEMFELEADAVEARATYFGLLDQLGTAITDAVGLPYQLRVRAIEKQRRKGTR